VEIFFGDSDEDWLSKLAEMQGLFSTHKWWVRARQRGNRVVITDLYLQAPEITPDMLRAVSVSRLEARLNAVRSFPAEERPRLTRPDGLAPDEFYSRVAAAYSEYAPRTRAPAKEIAAEAKVPITTVHRWIREARRRGFLPPARKGKAG